MSRLTEPEADAADITAAFFELSDIWSEANEAAFFELGLEFWRFVGHNDMFAGTNEIIGKTFSAFIEVDFDFVEIGDGVDFLIGFFV